MIWCWMLVLLATSPAHAFYHTDKQSEGPIFQKERCYEAWDTGERAFALYDNLDCPLDKLSQGSLIPDLFSQPTNKHREGPNIPFWKTHIRKLWRASTLYR